MAIVIVVLIGLLSLMYVGWRNRKRRQSAYGELAIAPDALGSLLGTFSGFYVATTVADDPLDRVAVRGLGFRSRTTVTVNEAGLSIAIPGVDPFIPAADIRSIGRSTWTIDRVVEDGGLIRVGWDLGTKPVDSYFRLDSPQEFIDAASRVSGTRTGSDAS